MSEAEAMATEDNRRRYGTGAAWSRGLHAWPARKRTVALLALPLQAQAQTTYVSNIGQSENATALGITSFDQGQGFTTGTDSAGHVLASVDIKLESTKNSESTGSEIPTVTIVQGTPTGTVVATLMNPASLAANTTADYTFTAPANTTLSASTTYYIVMEGGIAGISTARTSLDVEDSGGESDWSIADVSNWRSSSSNGSFSTNANALMIKVKGPGGTTLSTDATLSDLDLADAADGSAIDLNEMFAAATKSYTADVANSIDEITIAPTVNESNATYEIQDGTGTVTADYRTVYGTATAGQDYESASGTVTFRPGQTRRTVKVVVVADAHDDPGETFTLRLSNPSGAYIGDGEGTATLTNSGPMPGAWLSRFGRVASDHAVQAIEARIYDTSGHARENHLTIGGQRVDWQMLGRFAPSRDGRPGPGGGDAETGAGLELGGGLGYAAGNLSVEVSARGLVAHEDTAYEEWGCRSKQTAPDEVNGSHCYYVTHPCHPLHGYRFELIRTFNSLGTIRAEFLGPDGQKVSVNICRTVSAKLRRNSVYTGYMDDYWCIFPSFGIYLITHKRDKSRL